MIRQSAKVAGGSIAGALLVMILAGCAGRSDNGELRTYYSDRAPAYYNNQADYSDSDSPRYYQSAPAYYGTPAAATAPAPTPVYIVPPPSYQPAGTYYYPAPTYRDANGYYVTGSPTDYYYRPALGRR